MSGNRRDDPAAHPAEERCEATPLVAHPSPSSPRRLALSPQFFSLATRLASLLPLPAGYWLAAVLGEFYFWVHPGHSRHAVTNIAVVLAQPLSHPAARRIARASFRAYAMSLLDFLRLPAMAAATIERGVISCGWEHLDAALAMGRGVLIVAAHAGSWDRAAPLLAGRGYRVTLVTDAVGPPILDAAVQQVRQRHGLATIPANGGAALRQIYAALGRNEIVVLVMDRPMNAGGVAVQFFGQSTRLPNGPARLSLRSGAPLLHAWLVRRPDLLSFQGGFEPVPVPPSTGNRAADEQIVTQALADRLAHLIQTYPEQWYMFRPMWEMKNNEQ